MADMVKGLTLAAVNRSFVGSSPTIRPIDKKQHFIPIIGEKMLFLYLFLTRFAYFLPISHTLDLLHIHIKNTQSV